MSSLTRRLSTSLVGNTVLPAVGFLTAPLLARGLGVSQRGELAAAMAPIALASVIASFGVPVAATYFVAHDVKLTRIVARHSAWLILLAGIGSSAAIATLSGWLGGGDHRLAWTIALVGTAVTPTLLVGLLQAIAAGGNQWARITAERVISSLIRLFGIVILTVSGTLSPASAAALLALAPILAGTVYLRPRWPANDTDHNSARFSQPKRMLGGFGIRVWIGSVSGTLLSRVDQFLMVPLSSTTALGYYAVAVAVSEIALVLNSSMREVLFTDAVAGFDGQRLAFASRVSTIVALSLGVVSGIGAYWGLPILFGASFAGAIPATLILIAAVVLGNPGSLAGVGLSALGRPGLRSVSLLAGCLANLLLLVVLVPRYGATGAAVATLIGNLVASNLNIYLLHRVFGIQARGFYSFSTSDLTFVKTRIIRLAGNVYRAGRRKLNGLRDNKGGVG